MGKILSNSEIRAYEEKGYHFPVHALSLEELSRIHL